MLLAQLLHFRASRETVWPLGPVCSTFQKNPLLLHALPPKAGLRWLCVPPPCRLGWNRRASGSAGSACRLGRHTWLCLPCFLALSSGAQVLRSYTPPYVSPTPYRCACLRRAGSVNWAGSSAPPGLLDRYVKMWVATGAYHAVATHSRGALSRNPNARGYLTFRSQEDEGLKRIVAKQKKEKSEGLAAKQAASAGQRKVTEEEARRLSASASLPSLTTVPGSEQNHTRRRRHCLKPREGCQDGERPVLIAPQHPVRLPLSIMGRSKRSIPSLISTTRLVRAQRLARTQSVNLAVEQARSTKLQHNLPQLPVVIAIISPHV